MQPESELLRLHIHLMQHYHSNSKLIYKHYKCNPWWQVLYYTNIYICLYIVYILLYIYICIYIVYIYCVSLPISLSFYISHKRRKPPTIFSICIHKYMRKSCHLKVHKWRSYYATMLFSQPYMCFSYFTAQKKNHLGSY